MKKTNQRQVPKDKLSTVRIRLLLREEDLGLEPLFFHLQSIEDQAEQSKLVRSLLVAPAAVEPELLDVLRQTELDKDVEESLTIRISISPRDAGLSKALQELNAMAGSTKRQRIYVKRRLLFLLAANGIGPNGALLMQFAEQAMRQGKVNPSVVVEAMSLPNNAPALATSSKANTNTSIPISENKPIQSGGAPPPSQLPESLPAFDADDPLMDFSPIKNGSEENNTENKPEQGVKSKRFKANAEFFGNAKK